MTEARGTETGSQWVSCPWCGVRIRLFTGIYHDELPEDGDYAICAACLRFAFFIQTAVGLGLRRANAWETEALMADPEFREARAALERNETAAQAADELRSRDDGEGPPAGS